MTEPARPWRGADDDLYAILGLAPTATQDDIRHAYRLLARSCHPDVTRSPKAAERFGRLAAVYEVLGDPGRRRAYDAGRRVRPESPPSPGVSAVHHAPAPSWNPAVRGPAASRRPADHLRPSADRPRPQRSSTDEWKLASALAKVLLVAAVVMLVGLSAMVIVTARSEPDRGPVPTTFCKTPNGWMDCREAVDPSFP